MLTTHHYRRRLLSITAVLSFALLIVGGVAAQPATVHAALSNAPVQFGDPCRDAQGNEICSSFQRNDGRINANDPLQTATGYCQADHAIQIWAIVNGVGQFAGSETAAYIESSLQTAVTKNAAQTIISAHGIQLIGLPSGQLQLVDTGSGYTFTFSPTVCGLPAIAGNTKPSASQVGTPVATNSVPALPTTIVIPVVAPIGSQIQNTIRLVLRTGPGYTYAGSLAIPRGSFLTVLGKVPMRNGVQWIQVQYGTSVGWLLAYYTNINVRVLRNLPLVTIANAGATPTATPGN